MAEYSRRQENQLSRAIANSETGGRQLQKNIDNRDVAEKNRTISKLIQLSPLDNACFYMNTHVAHCGIANSEFQQAVASLENPDDNKASGLEHWSLNTLRAGDEHYNELFFLNHDPDMSRLGTDNRTEPDIIGDNNIAEIKTTSVDDASSITTLVREAIRQLLNRRGFNTSNKKVGLYLHNINAFWPFFNKQTLEDADDASFLNYLRGVIATPQRGIIFKIWYSCLEDYRTFIT